MDTEPTWTDYDEFKTTEETFAYDGVHRLTDVDDDTRVTLEWNALDRLTAEKLEVNLEPTANMGNGDWTAQKTTSYTWDDTGGQGASLPVTSQRCAGKGRLLTELGRFALEDGDRYDLG